MTTAEGSILSSPSVQIVANSGFITLTKFSEDMLKLVFDISYPYFSSIIMHPPDASEFYSGVIDGWDFIFPYPVSLLAHRQV